MNRRIIQVYRNPAEYVTNGGLEETTKAEFSHGWLPPSEAGALP